MIHLTRPNRQSFALSCDLIKFVERAPDTILTLVTGEKVQVCETPQQVLDLVLHSMVLRFRLTGLIGKDGTYPQSNGEAVRGQT
jgi:uncharacterized protein YlzI (FlbEa/FlbD family)